MCKQLNGRWTGECCRGRTSSGLVCSFLGRSWCEMEHCKSVLATCGRWCGVCVLSWADLESAAHAEDTVVGLLGRETLEGKKNGL
jgi:hypothetical protein